jgi:hypothetical protein
MARPRGRLIYRAEVLTTPAQGRTPDDVAADALRAVYSSGLGSSPEVRTHEHPTGQVSITVKFRAADDPAAQSVSRQIRDSLGTAADVASIRTGSGRNYRRVAVTR